MSFIKVEHGCSRDVSISSSSHRSPPQKRCFASSLDNGFRCHHSCANRALLTYYFLFMASMSSLPLKILPYSLGTLRLAGLMGGVACNAAQRNIEVKHWQRSPQSTTSFESKFFSLDTAANWCTWSWETMFEKCLHFIFSSHVGTHLLYMLTDEQYIKM